MASFFGLGAKAKINIKLNGQDQDGADMPVKMVKGDAERGVEDQKLYVVQNKDSISGTVTIESTKSISHIGIKMEVIGEIEMYYDRSNVHEFTSCVLELEPQGTLKGTKELTFDFPKVDKPYESYNGLNVRLRYFVRCTITRGGYGNNIQQEQEFWVQAAQVQPEINSNIKMEVGIEDCLHIEFEYNKSKYSLSDVIIGKIYFLLVRIKIKYMEIAIIRREVVGATQGGTTPASDTLTKFEVMDGRPVKGEIIPIRLFLKSFPLTPTYRNINNKFSVKYFLNLVLIDEEDRRYFKQQEIVLWRENIG